jgi:hypothetical protein
MAPPRPRYRGLNEEADGAGVEAALWKPGRGVQNSQLACWEKRFPTRVQSPLAALGPLGGRPGRRRGAQVAAAGQSAGSLVCRPLMEEPKKVESLKQDAQVESMKAEPMTVERRPTRPCKGVGEPADHACRAPHRYAVPGVCGGGWQADREVTLTGLPTPLQ